VTAAIPGQPVSSVPKVRAKLWTRPNGVQPDAQITALAVLAFLAVTVWWLTQETRVPDFDSATHTWASFSVHDQIANGKWTGPFTEFNTYPPLGHLIGALGIFVGGYSAASVILALNVVFVPLLAAGCYGVGRLVGGPRAGLFAALFALGTPMIVSEAHEAYLDPAQAAFVAVSVWGILASRRFERWGVAALAGVGTGLAMLTKETSPIFLAGLLAIVIARGGWRHWRGLLAYAAAAAVVAGPWYVYHRTELHQLFLAHSSQANGAEPNPLGGTYPTFFSAKNSGWYFWDAANIQLRAGLLALFLLGTVAAIRSCVRRWGPENLYPELLGGAFLSWLGMTWLTHKDPRYDIAALVYIAVLGTAWIANASRRVRPWLTGVLFASVAASFLSVAFGLGGAGYQVRIALPGAYDRSSLGARYVTLYSTSGWLRGAPSNNSGNVLALMRGLRRSGVRGVGFCCVNPIDFNLAGLPVLAYQAGLVDKGTSTGGLASMGPKDVFLLAHAPMPGDPPPCQTLSDGTGIYAELGNPLIKPFAQYQFICPGRHPEIYGHT
jgi:4-amino-4-deoxy-L-arabinose transferase-like glycosyltransferase